MSSPINWTEFLKNYAAAANASEWPGHPGASDEAIAAVERRLITPLPPSYREFLKASNGWQKACDSVPVLRAVEKIKWFRREHREWVDAYVMTAQGIDSPIGDLDYFSYTEEASAKFDVKHFAQTLCISEVGDDAVILLNPSVVWPDGEWEVWFFANWIPGAIRYRSFADWMRHEYAKLSHEPAPPFKDAGGKPTIYRDGPGKVNRRLMRIGKMPSFKTVLKNLSTLSNENGCIKAAKRLGRIGGKEAIDVLLTTLKNHPHARVRIEAAHSLGHLNAHEAIDALIAAVDDDGVKSSAVHALGGIKEARVNEFLLKLLETNHAYASAAAYHLALRDDDRAIPHLVRLALSRDPNLKRKSDGASQSIAYHRNEAAYTALESLLTHSDPQIRRRTIPGVAHLAHMAKQKSLQFKTLDLLKRAAQNETESDLKESMENWIRTLAPRA